MQNFANFCKIKLDHFVDLEKCCKMSIWLRKSVLIQPRTSLGKSDLQSDLQIGPVPPAAPISFLTSGLNISPSELPSPFLIWLILLVFSVIRLIIQSFIRLLSLFFISFRITSNYIFNEEDQFVFQLNDGFKLSINDNEICSSWSLLFNWKVRHHRWL